VIFGHLRFASRRYLLGRRLIGPDTRSCEVETPGAWILPTASTAVILALLGVAVRKLRTAGAR
jgi:hypothetical protein